jgi:hypothetical protein
MVPTTPRRPHYLASWMISTAVTLAVAEILLKGLRGPCRWRVHKSVLNRAPWIPALPKRIEERQCEKDRTHVGDKGLEDDGKTISVWQV